MTVQETDGLSIRTYLRVVARRKWLVVAVTLVIGILGSAYTWTRPAVYAASTDLVYVQPIDISSPLTPTYIDPGAQQSEIEAMPTVISSSVVGQDAAKRMRPATVKVGYSVTGVLTPGASTNYSNVVSIDATSSAPAAAADAANAYAAAFTAWGRDSARAKVANAITVVQSQLDSYSSANRSSSEYKALESTLSQLQLLEASASGDFKVITQAYPSSAPISPKKKRGILVAFAGGLILGIGLAFLLEQFDTRVRGDEQITELLNLPIIGRVPRVGAKNKEKSVLQTLSEPTSPAAEAYRVLRSNLDFVSMGGDMKILLISSSVQGEGKSVAACNLAVSMALAGKNIVLVDADLRSPRVHAYVGLPNAVGVSSLIARRADLQDALVPVSLNALPRRNGSLVMTTQLAPGAGEAPAEPGYVWPGGPGESPVLRVLPSGPLPPNPGEMVASARFGEILREIAAGVDVVLVDAPAMLPVGDTAAVAPWVDGMAFVVNPELVRRPVLEQARAQLLQLPCRLLGVIEIAERKGSGYYGGYYSHGDAGRLKRKRG